MVRLAQDQREAVLFLVASRHDQAVLQNEGVKGAAEQMVLIAGHGVWRGRDQKLAGP